ncbi:electron transfer flavoprotein subunit beta/FixA family protein [Acidobacteria bacterium AH-259-D05]|nr:electron transfer flavoprotein subunit beta/FixA family protein [Acidobacteria bacterium AH-259-D05]
MKIVTCLKEVPDRDTRYEIDSEGRGIKESDLTFQINECDEYALEESLKLSEKHDGEVVILTAGRQRAEKSIRKGLAMGANRAILVRDEEEQLKTPHAVAMVLAEVLKQENYDLILTGTQSDDWSYAQTGVLLAQLLGLPHATIVMEIQAEPSQKKVKALREMESGWFQWVELPMPAVLTVQAGISQVRYASLRGIMQAKKKEIRNLELRDLGLDLSAVPQLEVLRVYFPEMETKAEILEGATETVVEQLVEKLKKEAKVL